MSLDRTLSYLSIVIRIALGAIFIYASIDKVIYPFEFAKIVHNYRLLPGFTINIWAAVLPWIELVCGVLLVLGLYRGGALTVITFLLVIFMVAVGINIIRGVNLQCGCFTVSANARADAWGTFVRDSWLLAMALFVYFFDTAALTLDKLRLRKT
jgi:putative oxidoreductase